MKKHDHLYMLQRDCGELEGGSSYNCLNPLQGGADPNVTLFNHKDIVGITYASDGSITGITLANNKSGFKYEGFGKSVTPQIEAIKSASGQNLAKHQVGLVVFDRSQKAKNNIQKIMLGDFAAVVRSKVKDSTAFEVYGLGSALQLVPGVIHQLNENNGAYSVILATPDGLFEPKLPPTFYDGTSFATTNDVVSAFWYLPAVLNLSVLAVTAAGGTALTVNGKNFFGSGAAADVSSVKWVNQSTLAEVNQTGLTISSNTVLSFSSVALTAGTYKLKVTTSKGVAFSVVNVISS